MSLAAVGVMVALATYVTLTWRPRDGDTWPDDRAWRTRMGRNGRAEVSFRSGGWGILLVVAASVVLAAAGLLLAWLMTLITSPMAP